MNTDNTVNTMGRCALLLCLALAPVRADADADAPLPARAESARLRGALQVVSMALQVKPGNEAPMIEACRKWKLTTADVRSFFAKAAPITGEEFHAHYYVTPCEYAGQIELGGERYEFVINGGSYAHLRTASAPVIVRAFGCLHGCEHLVPFGDYPRED
jgi:hypothetical protein